MDLVPELRAGAVTCRLHSVRAASCCAIVWLTIACSPSRADHCAYDWHIPAANLFETPGGVFNVLWPASALAAAVPGYTQEHQGVTFNLLSTISEIPPNELSRWKAGSTEVKSLRSIYFRNGGRWKDAVVSKNQDVLGGYRITTADNAGTWVVSKVDPSTSPDYPPLEDWFVGICHTRRSGPIAGLPKCLFRWRARKDLAVEVDIAGSNFQHVEEIKVYMNAKIQRWSTPLAQPRRCR